MKKFLFGLILFTLIPICLISLSGLVVRWKSIELLQENDQLKKSSILILGDSRSRSALNPKFIRNTVNCSQNSEQLIYTYNKLREIVKCNPQIDKVILSVSYHSFTCTDGVVESNITDAVEMLSRYLPVIDLRDLILLFQYNGSTLIPALPRLLWKQLISLWKPNNRQLSFIGEYCPLDRMLLNDSTVNSAITRHFTDCIVSKERNYPIQYLRKIISLCKECDVQLYLINLPVSREYYQRIPHDHIEGFNEMKDRYFKHNYYDFSSYPLEKFHFADADHLNQEGAEVFSKMFAKELGM